MSSRRLCSWSTLAVIATLAAQSAFAAAFIRFDIPAQPLGNALRALASQADTNVMFNEPLVAGKSAGALRMEGTLDEALARVLADTGIMYRFLNEKTVVLGEGREASVSLQGLRLAQTDSKDAESGGGEGSDVGVEEEGRQTTSERSDAAAQRNGEEDSERGGIPEILVTGSKVLNTDIRRTEDDIQPYVVFGRERIERSSAVNLEEFLKKELTMNVSPIRGVQAEGAGNKGHINLRGLGTDETLILIDGRRAVGFNFEGTPNQPDINGIPLAAVERIEVLPTTASGVFGGGATGGVINVVLRRDYSGLETQLTYGNSFESDTATRRVDFSGGFSLENGRTNVMLSGSYSDANPLLAQERELAQRGRQRILDSNNGDLQALNGQFGGPPLGATTNIVSADGTDLTLDSGAALNSPITFVPEGYAGAAIDGGAALAANARQYNLDLSETAQQGGGRYGLLGAPETQSLMLTMRRELTPRLQMFLELKAFESSTEFSANFADLTTTIGADAPNNPFQQAITVTVPTVGMDEAVASDSKERRGVAGIIAKLPGQWQASLDFTWSRQTSSYVWARPLSEASIIAVNSGAQDVLRDVNRFPIPWESYDPSGQTPGDMELRNTALRLGGELPWALPGGKPLLSSLIEYREETIGDVIQFCGGCAGPIPLPFFYPSRSQNVSSAYLESRFPLVTPMNKKPGLELLELQVAIRGDEYRITTTNAPLTANALLPIERTTSKDTSVDPTVGFRYRPVRDLMLRTSYGTGYLPPSLSQLAPTPPSPTNLGFAGMTDPLRGNEPIDTVLLGLGGNPNLRPEESESWAAGLILTPRGVPGLRVSADWNLIEKLDNISNTTILFFGAQAQSSLETLINFFPERVTRAAPSDGFQVGPITGLDATMINIASMRVEAIDLAIDYTLETERFGMIDISADATRLISLKTQAAPTAAVVENLGVLSTTLLSALKWKANASLNWAYKGWQLGWRTSFFDSYFLNLAHTVNPRQGSASVPNQMYHDLYGAYGFSSNGALASGLFADTEIRFGINNVFNKQPPVDVVNNQFLTYSYFGDPQLANYYVSISKSFGQ